jgi:PII-like signaling protein
MKTLLLRIYLSENDRYKGKNAHHAVIEFLKDKGIAGATVHHCMEGYGIHHKIHTASVLRLGTDLPVIVQAVDKEEKIRNLIPELKEMLPTELMVVQEVEVVSGEGFEKE